MLIAHTKVKTIVEKGMNADEGYMQLTSNITNSYEDSISAMFDIVCTGMIDKKVEDGRLEGTERRLYFRNDGFVEAGGRIKSSAIPTYIVFDEDEKANAKLFLTTLKEGIKSSKSKPVSDEEFKKLVEEEQKENETLAEKVMREEEQSNKPSKEEMIETLKIKLKDDPSRKSVVLTMVKSYGKKNINELSNEELEEILNTI